MTCKLDLNHLKEIFKEAKKNYKIIRCMDYLKEKASPENILINRVDIDLNMEQAKTIAQIFFDLEILATFFIRLHGPYNPFAISNLQFLYDLKSKGCEIGFHSEVMDCRKCLNLSPEWFLECGVSVFRTFLFDVRGAASHNEVTGINNQDFWKDRKCSDFGLYDAYGEMFWNSFYVSDSEIRNWKCYDYGKLVDGDRRCLCEHLKDNHKILYTLTHPLTYFMEVLDA